LVPPAVPPERRRARPLAPQVQRAPPLVPLLAQRQVRPAGQVARALVPQVPVVQVPVAQVARAQAAGQAATRPFAAFRTTEK
jgi:hypothetical protein